MYLVHSQFKSVVMYDKQFERVSKKHQHSHTEQNPTNSKVGKTTVKHHVPPKHPDKHPRTIEVDEHLEKCYHKLFGNAKSYKDACTILLRDWWTDRNGNFIK